jgi:type IV pilus assembly protein PilA
MNTPRAFTRSKISKGFTLIELMIGIAIIGVLSAIAIPAFQDYLNRSKVTELVNLAQACKAGVVEVAATTNAWPTSAAAAGCQAGVANNSQYASGLTVGPNSGRIQVNFRANAVVSGIVATDYIALVPWVPNATGGGSLQTVATDPISQWRCVTNITGDNLRYIPASCRNAG